MDPRVRRQKDLPPGENPMGELVREMENPPFNVWIPKENAIVLGNSQKAERECNLPNVLADEIPLYKRKGGGGAVLLSSKGFCYALRFKKDPFKGIHDYFDRGTGALQNFLESRHSIKSEPKGISDLSIGNRKILGCSLYMPRDSVIYLASVLFEDDSENIEKYLSHPSLEPDYRKGRTHQDFITCLRPHLGPQVSLQNFVAEFQAFLPVSLETELKF